MISIYGDFRQFSAEKLLFMKTNVMANLLHTLVANRLKNKVFQQIKKPACSQH
jgi:hypothetical protein